MLINLIVIGETPPQIALAAAITLKNFVKGNWVCIFIEIFHFIY